MTEYVADTHSVLWSFSETWRLGSRAAAVFSEVNNGTAALIVPVIVIAELIFVLEARRASVDLDTVLATLTAMPNVEIVDLALERVLTLRVLQALPSMHDRMIVAETLHRGATLSTRDRVIASSGLVPVVW